MIELCYQLVTSVLNITVSKKETNLIEKNISFQKQGFANLFEIETYIERQTLALLKSKVNAN